MSYDQWKATDQLGEQESACQARLEAKAKEIRDGMNARDYAKEIECDAFNIDTPEAKRIQERSFNAFADMDSSVDYFLSCLDFSEKWLDKEAMRQAIDALARGE